MDLCICFHQSDGGSLVTIGVATNLITGDAMPTFYMNIVDSNLGPHACIAGTLTQPFPQTESSLQNSLSVI